MSNLEVVLVKGGSFSMGSTEGYADERPVHQVTFSDFFIGKYVVTQKEWQAIMGSNPSVIKRGDLPVTNISWNEVQKFLTKLNAKKTLIFPAIFVNSVEAF